MPAEEIRMPAVAGQFYEGTAESLRRQIDGLYKHRLGPGRLPEVDEQGPRGIIGLVCPHAGYPYSGPMAARSFYELARDGHPEVAVVIGFSHRYGLLPAVQTAGAWRTPLGDMQIAAEVAEDLADALPRFATGAADMQGEHSIEVQLPFLQHLYGDAISLVPVMMVQQTIEAARLVGQALAGVLEQRDAVIIASTDMTHYEAPLVALRQDELLTERIVAMDAEGLIRERDARGISMCGAGAVAALLIAARLLGATRAEKLGYSNSGDIIPSSEVVGYLSAKIVR